MFKVYLRNFGQNCLGINEKNNNLWIVVLVFEYKRVVFCGILEDYSNFFKKKKKEGVVIKLLKFLNCINSSCLGYCILEVAGRLLEE